MAHVRLLAGNQHYAYEDPDKLREVLLDLESLERVLVRRLEKQREVVRRFRDALVRLEAQVEAERIGR